MIIGLNKTFYHTTVTTHEIEKFIADFLHLNLTSFFDQYLRDNKVPTFQYRIIDNILHYKWVNCIPSFDMPLKVKINKKEVTLSFKPNGASNTIEINEDKATIKVDPNYYIYTHNIMGEN